MSTLHTAATNLLLHGINPIPVRADGSKAPALNAWQRHTTTQDDLDTWFGGERPRYTAMGIVTGPASGNLELTEIEGAHAHRIPELAQAAHDAGLGATWEKVNAGWLELSPSGGFHWIYRVEGQDVPGNTKLAQATDRSTIAETRGAGGQFVAAPTGGHAHASGKPWALLRGGVTTVPTLTKAERQDFHQLLAAVLDERHHAAAEQPPAFLAGTGPLAQLHAAETARRAELGGITPGDDFEAKTTWAQILEPHGWRQLFARGNTIFWCRPGKSAGISATTGHADDRDRLFVFSSSTDFETETPYTKFGAHALLNHGGDHSAAASALAKDGYGEEAHRPAPAAPAQPAAPIVEGNVLHMPDPDERPAPAPALTLLNRTLELTDDSNALALIDTYGQRLRYDADRGRWLVWDAHRWAVQPGTGGEAREMAKAVARSLPAYIAGEEPSKVSRHNRYSLSERGVTAMLNTARTDSRITVTSDDLDAHPLELNTPGGIVDLATGQLRPADPARLHTRTTNATPDAAADPSLWDRFLTQALPDPGTRIYVQRVVGHSLLGEVRQHILPFAYGGGGNGKGTLLEALRDVLGSYAGSAPAGFLMATHYAQHPTELADLQGRRFVIASEINPGDRFDEAKVKALTGGDTIKARYMRQDYFEFRPTHSLWLMGNDQPAVESGGVAFWRRLRLLPFTHTVPESERIEDLQGILARDHGAAILAWAVQGAVDYLAHGLQEPEGVRAATELYAASVDTVGLFIEERCTLAASQSTSVGKLRSAYEAWCREAGEKAVTGRAFSAQLSRHGVKVGRDAPKGTGGARQYGGILLNPLEQEPDAQEPGSWYEPTEPAI